MYAEIAAAVESVKALTGLISSASNLTNKIELLAAVNAVQEKLSQALVSNLESAEKQAALRDRVHDLEKKISEIKNWETKTQRYALFQFPTGSLAYALKAGMEQGEPHHYLCAHCLDKGQIAKLQPSINGSYFNCPSCEKSVSVKDHGPMNRRGSFE